MKQFISTSRRSKEKYRSKNFTRSTKSQVYPLPDQRYSKAFAQLHLDIIFEPICYLNENSMPVLVFRVSTDPFPDTLPINL